MSYSGYDIEVYNIFSGLNFTNIWVSVWLVSDLSGKDCVRLWTTQKRFLKRSGPMQIYIVLSYRGLCLDWRVL
jgi:hypothetical protein